jgi:hypothetical protein
MLHAQASGLNLLPDFIQSIFNKLSHKFCLNVSNTKIIVPWAIRETVAWGTGYIMPGRESLASPWFDRVRDFCSVGYADNAASDRGSEMTGTSVIAYKDRRPTQECRQLNHRGLAAQIV